MMLNTFNDRYVIKIIQKLSWQLLTLKIDIILILKLFLCKILNERLIFKFVIVFPLKIVVKRCYTVIVVDGGFGLKMEARLMRGHQTGLGLRHECSWRIFVHYVSILNEK